MGSSSVVDYGIWMIGLIAVVVSVLILQTVLTGYSSAYSINTGGKSLIVGDTLNQVANMTTEINNQMSISGQSSNSFITRMISAAWSAMKIFATLPSIISGFLYGITTNFPLVVGGVKILPFVLTGIVVMFVFTLVYSTFFGTRPA